MLSNINVKGTNHEIGGDIADGQWVSNLVTVFSSVNFSATGTSTYTVSNYLPDDDNTYEVMVIGYASTGTSSGCTSNWWVRDSNNDYSQSIGYCLTRTNSNVASGNSGILPLKQVGGVLTLKIGVTGIGSGTTGGNGLYLAGYRRLGGVPIPAVYYTLTINPTPADATVTFSTGTVSGNSCTVADGTSVTYTVSKSGYTTQTGTVTVNADQTVNVTLLQITGIPMYGWTYTMAGNQIDVYVVGENSLDGYVASTELKKITAISGSVGDSGSKITVEGWSAASYQSSVSYNGIYLHIYLTLGVLSNATVGKKALTSASTVMSTPTSISSSQMKFVDVLGVERTCTRKSSIDTTFTGE